MNRFQIEFSIGLSIEVCLGNFNKLRFGQNAQKRPRLGTLAPQMESWEHAWQKARPCSRHLTLQSLPRQEAPQAWMVLNWFSILIWVICPSWVLLKKHSNTYQDPVPGCLNLLAKQIIRECLLASPDTLDFGGFFPVLLENSMVFTAGTSPGQRKQHGFTKCKGAFSLYDTCIAV